ncbi:sulfatase-like hydrolase/transferase [Carboxylicivirga marina]|nr:sulfatase-like hydrolase/transferase [Carboxylicivirga marina]
MQFVKSIKKSLTFVGLFFFIQVSFAQKRPNILFIMSDDHSAATIGAYPSHLQSFLKQHNITPNIDKLASEGALLSNCYANNSLCAPSRASIITGRYSHTSGVFTLREELNGNETPTIAQVLQADNYETAVVGKWHIEGDCLQGYNYYAVTHGQGSYFQPSVVLKNGSKLKGGNAYVSDFYTDLAIEWLNQVNKDKPFFLMVHHKAAHGPWQYKTDDAAIANLFDGISIPEPLTLHDDYSNRHENGIRNKQHQLFRTGTEKDDLSKRMADADWATGTITLTGLTDAEQREAIYQKYLKDYLRCVKSIDISVGRLYQQLEAMGELDNTIIIYTSDQGMFMGEHNFYDKRLSLDEALRMPFIIRYPQEISPGTTSDDIVNNIDFAKTFCDYAGTTAPEEMQGISFRPLLRGEHHSNKRTATFFQFYSSSCPSHYGIRTKTHKLIRYCDSKNGLISGVDLFDLENDPSELVSIYDLPEHADEKNMMQELLENEIVNVKVPEGYLPTRREWKLHPVNFVIKDENGVLLNDVTIQIEDERTYTDKITVSSNNENTYTTHLHPYHTINITITKNGYNTLIGSINIPETKNSETHTFEYMLTNTATSINTSKAGEVKIYPNPTSDHFTLYCPDNQALITITNAEGKLFLRKIIEEQYSTISCSQWAAGTYWVSINTKNKKTTQQVIIK